MRKGMENVCSLNEKSKTLLTIQDISNSGATNIKYSDSKYYKPTPIEAERLQTLPDNYTAIGVIDGKEVPISNTQRYINAWQWMDSRRNSTYIFIYAGGHRMNKKNNSPLINPLMVNNRINILILDPRHCYYINLILFIFLCLTFLRKF